MSEPATLGEYVRQRMTDLGLSSLRDLKARTGLHFETGRRILDGRAVSETSLKRLADGLGLPLPRVRELAGRPRGELQPFRLPPEADQLTRRQRQVVLDVVAALLEASSPASRDQP